MKTTRLAAALLMLGSSAVFAADAAPKAVAAADMSSAALVDFMISGLAPGAEADARRAQLQKELVLQEAIISEANRLQLVDQRTVQMRMEIARRQAIVAAYWIDFFRRNPIQEATLKDIYTKLTTANGNRQFHLSQIAVADDAAAQKVMDELKRGKKPFATVAKSLSIDKQSSGNGGDLGWHWKTEIAPAVVEKLDAAKAGDLIGPLQTAKNVLSIVKVEGIREQQMPEFEKLKPQLENSIRQQMERQELVRLSKPAS